MLLRRKPTFTGFRAGYKAQALSAFLGQPAGLLAKLGGQSGAAQDLWLAHGKAHPLPINACGY
ncbi:MAG: hypothetical protein ACREDH_05330, partial [Methylocella sp.]